MLYVGKHSDRVKMLRRRIRRRVDGEVVVDGSRLVDDLVRWHVSIRELYLATSLVESGAADAWVVAAAEVFALDDSALAKIAPTRSPQGVLAVVDEPTAAPWNGRQGVAVWLDAVQDPGNLGAIIRVAAGLGGAAVLCGPGCADPFAPAAVRGAAGACFRVPVEVEVSISHAARLVRQHRGEVWATGNCGTTLHSWDPIRPSLLMLGAEGRGLSPQALELADGLVTIPLDRDVESLNVSVAAGVLLARVMRCE